MLPEPPRVGARQTEDAMTEQPRPIVPPGAADDEAPSRPDREHREELLDEAIEETFPASDPPAAPRFD